ncbi:hypothetical protein WMY93_003363 [Mugilogobius chulae]|uniref:Uncharacterized protein n=1 Tax=Mugilogobius chulae TaxID=88201 RepID=A0AAW0PZM4_9GOBI
MDLRTIRDIWLTGLNGVEGFGRREKEREGTDRQLDSQKWRNDKSRAGEMVSRKVEKWWSGVDSWKRAVCKCVGGRSIQLLSYKGHARESGAELKREEREEKEERGEREKEVRGEREKEIEEREQEREKKTEKGDRVKTERREK